MCMRLVHEGELIRGDVIVMHITSERVMQGSFDKMRTVHSLVMTIQVIDILKRTLQVHKTWVDRYRTEFASAKIKPLPGRSCSKLMHVLCTLIIDISWVSDIGSDIVLDPPLATLKGRVWVTAENSTIGFRTEAEEYRSGQEKKGAVANDTGSRSLAPRVRFSRLFSSVFAGR